MRCSRIEEITREEIRRGVGKAEGVCDISGELLKVGGDRVIEWLYKIYSYYHAHYVTMV